MSFQTAPPFLWKVSAGKRLAFGDRKVNYTQGRFVVARKAEYSFGVFGAFCVLALVVAAVIGWVSNLFAVIAAAKAGATVTVLLVLQAIGVVVPFLGALLGWLV